jgi:hypothetical protein
MKKYLTLLIIFFMTMHVHAQYGHRVYYTDSISNDWLNDGLISNFNLNAGVPVYMGVGRNLSTLTGSIERSRYVRVSLTGPTLNNRRYQFFRTGQELGSRLNAISEGNSYLMMGGTALGTNLNPVPGGSDLLLMKTTAVGVPSIAFKFDLGGGADEALCTRRSNRTSTNFHTCGSSTLQSLGQGRAFVMKHNNNLNTVSWVRTFSLPCTNGTAGTVEAVSVVDDSLSNTVVVVGNVRGTTGCQRAFIAKFSSTGTLRWLFFVTSTNGTDLDFQSIRETGMAEDYLITGSIALPNQGRRVLLMRVNTSGLTPVTLFAKSLFSTGPTPNFPVVAQFGYDVAVRSESGKNEFYVCGANQYTNTLTDGVVFKTDSLGTPLAQRIYFGNGRDQLNAIDVYSGASGSGFAAFGRIERIVSIGTPLRSQAWLSKGYYNLVTGCNEIADNPQALNLNLQYTAQSITTSSAFTRDSLTAQNTTVLNVQLCWATTVSGGSNARLGFDEEESEEVSPFSGDAAALDAIIFPNPSASEPVTLRLQSREEMEVTAVLFDVSGRKMDAFLLQLPQGESSAPLNTADLPAGVYFLQLTDPQGTVKTLRWMKR